METIQSAIRRSATWSIVLSLLMILSGALAIAVPPAAGVAVTLVVGWLLIFNGVLHLGLAWRGEGVASVLGEIAIAAIYTVAGGYMITSPVAGLSSLTLAIAASLIVKGILEGVIAVQARKAPGSGWLMFDALLTAAVAIMIANAWPASAAWAVGTLAGVAMMSSGFTRLILSVSIRKLVTA